MRAAATGPNAPAKQRARRCHAVIAVLCGHRPKMDGDQRAEHKQDEHNVEGNQHSRSTPARARLRALNHPQLQLAWPALSR